MRNLIIRQDELMNRADDLIIRPDKLINRPDDLLNYAPCPLGGSVPYGSVYFIYFRFL